MTEFEWVRELNEGVKKIYSDMEEAGLPAPEYIEMPNTVKLILRNNIDARQNKSKSTGIETGKETSIENGIETSTEKRIVAVIAANPKVTIQQIADKLEMSKNGVVYALNRLKEKGVVKREGATKNGKWLVERGE